MNLSEANNAGERRSVSGQRGRPEEREIKRRCLGMARIDANWLLGLAISCCLETNNVLLRLRSTPAHWTGCRKGRCGLRLMFGDVA
jgi:hypothetical protein